MIEHSLAKLHMTVDELENRMGGLDDESKFVFCLQNLCIKFIILHL